MSRLFLFVFALIFVFCEQKKIKYSGLNDMVVGVQHLILYEDQKFYLELSLGSEEGFYNIKNDTIFLNYNDKPNETWPDRLLIKSEWFESINTEGKSGYEIKIRRDK